jgi:hypothetical protein
MPKDMPMPPKEGPDDTKPPEWKPAQIALWAWLALFYGIWIPTTTMFVAEGWHILAPICSSKLAKIPVLGFIAGGLPGLEKATLGQMYAFLTVLGVAWFWSQMLKSNIDPLGERDFDVEAYKKVVMTVGAVLVGADMILFVLGVSALSWGKAGFNPAIVLMAVIMVALSVFGCLVSLRLKKQVEREKGGES